jgi:hypothetical protein
MTEPLRHDKRVCLFGVEHLARLRNGGSVHIDSFPDEEERQLQAIDVLARDNVGPIAAEHTLIEAYEGQVHENKRMQEVFDGFEERFVHALPIPGLFTLAIHLSEGGHFPIREQERAVEQLEGWVRSQAKKLPVPQVPPQRPNHVTAGPPQVPVLLTLYRMQCTPEGDGSLQVRLLRQADHEDRRVARVARALQDKLEKLETSRPQDGVTLLVVESRDFIMSNPSYIAQALHRASKSHLHIPNYIIHVDTSAGNGHWIVYYEKCEGWWSNRALDY